MSRKDERKNWLCCAAWMLAGVTLPVFAGPLLPTDVVVRIGDERHYFSNCDVPLNRLEPGDAGWSVLNIRACEGYELVTAQAPSWIKVRGVQYGEVFLPDRTRLGQCALIYQQIITAGSNARLSMTVECSEGVYEDGFELSRRPSR